MSDTMLLGVLRMPFQGETEMIELAGHENEFFEDCDCRRCAVEFRNRYRAALASVSEELGLPPRIGPAKGDLRRLLDEGKRAAETLRDLRAENETLRAFARDIMAPWPVGSVDGYEVQDLAIEHGLLVSETRTERCGDACECAEYHSPEEMADGVTCYRRGPLLKDGSGT